MEFKSSRVGLSVWGRVGVIVACAVGIGGLWYFVGGLIDGVCGVICGLIVGGLVAVSE